MVPMGVAQAVSVRVGLADGKTDHRTVSVVGRATVTLALIYGGAVALLLFCLRDPLAALFIGDVGPDYRAAREATSLLLILVAAFQVADNLQGVMAGLLRGLQDTLAPMFLAFIGFWAVGLGSAVLLNHVLGPPGVWLGLALGLATTAGLYARRWQQVRMVAPPRCRCERLAGQINRIFAPRRLKR
jgi:MATE family multidrug resistance protein